MKNSTSKHEPIIPAAERRGERIATIAKVDTVVSAILASACCWLPLVLIAAGHQERASPPGWRRIARC